MTDLTFNMKKGDTHKPLALQLKYKTSTSTAAVDLTGSTIKFYMRKRGENALTVNSGSCSITAALTGYCQYEWNTVDTDESGIFDGDVVVTFSDSKEETFPEDDNHIVIIVNEEL